MSRVYDDSKQFYLQSFRIYNLTGGVAAYIPLPDLKYT